MAEWDEGRGSVGNGHDTGALSAEAQLQEALDEAREQVDRYVEQAAAFVRERPVLCLAGAVAVGYLVGKLASRR